MEDLAQENRIPGRTDHLRLIFLGIGLGGMIGAVGSAFMYAQHYLIELLWEIIPHHLGGISPLYVVVTSVLGGLVIGIGRKYLGNDPQPMQTIIHSVKIGKGLPGIRTVPTAFLLSLISLGFGAALGPEAALVGIAAGFSVWVNQVISSFSQRLNLADPKNPWSKIPGYVAVLSGMIVFMVSARPMFNISYPYIPYRFSISGDEILISILLGFVGLFLGKMFSNLGTLIDRMLVPLKDRHIMAGLLGGGFLGILGGISPLILFSGQAGLSTLFSEGMEIGGLFLILIGLLKLIATKACTATGWKGGEIFPVMFASAAIGLGISNLIPGIHPMIGIAATMAATTTIVLNGVPLALAITLLFLPGNLFVPMLISSLVASVAGKRLSFGQELVAEGVPVESRRRWPW